eukprot:1792360-Amphidinium_carterae.1
MEPYHRDARALIEENNELRVELNAARAKLLEAKDKKDLAFQDLTNHCISEYHKQRRKYCIPVPFRTQQKFWNK